MLTNVLVTGGAGFIGSHLCEKLTALSVANVVSLDNYFTGSIENHIPGVKYINGSTVDIFKLIDFKPDFVFHLGEYSRVEQSFDDIDIVFHSNKLGTFAVLEFCKLHSSKLIYAGSSTKFGDGGLGRSASPYAWTKASNTELVINYGSWFNLNYVISYFYNVYGPREISSGKYATVIAKFCELYKQGLPLTVVEPGTQLRNFTHVYDIIDGLLLLAEFGSGDDYGIGDETSYSILEVAQLFNHDLIMLPNRPGNRLSADVVTSKTKSLGWSSKHSLKSYIDNFLSVHR